MIDPTQPIEAVHPDGRVVPVEYDCSQEDGIFYTTTSPEPYHTSAVWYADGTNYMSGNSWTIRNVVEATAEPEQSVDPDDWAIEEALKRGEWVDDVDAADIREMASLGYTSYKCVLAFARMIQKYEPHLKPKPAVDPDVAAVREILAAWCVAEPNGDLDGNPDFLAAVAAFKRVKGGVS